LGAIFLADFDDGGGGVFSIRRKPSSNDSPLVFMTDALGTTKTYQNFRCVQSAKIRDYALHKGRLKNWWFETLRRIFTFCAWRSSLASAV
jgi:hypothetical protein